MNLDPTLHIENLGSVDYEVAESFQLECVRRVSLGEMPETLIFCVHPPCVTLGRSTAPEDVVNWSGPVHKVSRGGRATYHGPGQMVVYPILNLALDRPGLRARDLHHYLHFLSDTTCEVLDSLYGLKAQPEPMDPSLFSTSGKVYFTGVWRGNRKLGSIGIAVKKWISYHGLALNIHWQERAFEGLVPCGFQAETMTSLEEELGEKVDRKVLEAKWAEVFQRRLFRRS